MCLAIPMLITEVEDKEATVEIGGVSRRISIYLTPEAGVGDYVLIHAGYAINILEPGEAEETLKLFQEMAEAEQTQDRI